jgi:hypothetical protein
MDADAPGIADHARREKSLMRLRAVARSLAILAVLAVVAAVLLNWRAMGSLRVASSARSGTGAGGFSAEELPKPPLDMLPSTVLSYETIARQPVPGTGGVDAEAIYVTLNMDIEIQVPIVIYARVSGKPAPEEAQRVLEDTMASYPLRRGELALGHGVVATAGLSRDESAWMAGWTEGQYVILVKSTYRDKAPFEKRDFLTNLGKPVAEAVARYVKTGTQGIEE